MDWTAYEKQCYLLARNEKEYLKDGSFNRRVEQLLTKIPAEEQQAAIAVMEKMVSYAPEYYEAEQRYLPILIYKSEPICYGILRHFGDCMKDALEELGECVEIFDCTVRPLKDLKDFSNRKYKAVLGFQSYFFSIRLTNGEHLHHYFDAPLYNMQFDHPIIMHRHLMEAPENLTYLVHDSNYQRFLQKYYSGKVKADLLPPGGEGCCVPEGKKMDLSFVGSYYNWTVYISELKELNAQRKGLARMLIHEMKHHPNQTYEACFEKVMAQRQEEGTLEQMRELLYAFRSTYLCIMLYYRDKVVGTLLEDGIFLDVYGETWNDSPFVGYGNLIRHPEVTEEESLQVYAQSRLSLNVMSWHKAGMTERIANIMLCRTVVVSDKSDYLTENFQDEEDLLLFDLEHIEELPAKIRELLEDPGKTERIAENGYRKAQEQHTWKRRAEQFLEIVNKGQ